MAKITIQLIGGEKDGWPDQLDVEAGTRPELVYTWRTEDDDRMKKVHGDARRVLAERLGILAYRFDEVIEKPGCIDGFEYQYIRAPEADKKLTSA